MGPSILFDKSAIQSLGRAALHEVSRYFYTVVPPVLLMETLADLSLKPDDLEGTKKKVADIASKMFPVDSIANADYRTMCIHNLLGEHVPMQRLPAVVGAQPVVAKDGSRGAFIDIQPENEAVLRWRTGQVNEDDLKFAVRWRESAHGTNLEEMRKALPKPPIRVQSAEQARDVVDVMLAQPELQQPLLGWFVGLLRCDSATSQRIGIRWKWAVDRTLASFAPYAYHCLRVQLLFYTGMIQGVFGTRASNVVDLEYLHYTPFVFVFCSGDKIHQQLAQLVLQGDQTFVNQQDFQEALNVIAAARKDALDAEPREDSLIRRLWLKHWKKSPRQAARRAVSEDESKRIMESVKPIIEALQEQERKSGPRFPV